jgi:hypothetical protein
MLEKKKAQLGLCGNNSAWLPASLHRTKKREQSSLLLASVVSRKFSANESNPTSLLFHFAFAPLQN